MNSIAHRPDVTKAAKTREMPMNFGQTEGCVDAGIGDKLIDETNRWGWGADWRGHETLSLVLKSVTFV
jgi:hypothetical protein